MIIRRVSATVLAAVLFACTGGGGPIDDTGNGSSSGTTPPPPAPEGQVVASGGLEVKAAFAAATLGDEGCAGSSGTRDESGFAPSSGDSAAKCGPSANTAGDVAPGGTTRCGGGCRPSNLQISFTTGATGTTAKVEISSVTLHDASSDVEIAKLTVSNAQLWDKTSSTYKSWDGTLGTSLTANASYTLSTPKLDRSFDKKYRMEVTLIIDGRTIVLESNVLAREPDVAT